MISGIQCNITFDLDLDTIGDLLDLEEEEVYDLWNDGKLDKFINETIPLSEIFNRHDVT